MLKSSISGIDYAAQIQTEVPTWSSCFHLNWTRTSCLPWVRQYENFLFKGLESTRIRSFRDHLVSWEQCKKSKKAQTQGESCGGDHGKSRAELQEDVSLRWDWHSQCSPAPWKAGGAGRVQRAMEEVIPDEGWSLLHVLFKTLGEDVLHSQDYQMGNMDVGAKGFTPMKSRICCWEEGRRNYPPSGEERSQEVQKCRVLLNSWQILLYAPCELQNFVQCWPRWATEGFLK